MTTKHFLHEYLRKVDNIPLRMMSVVSICNNFLFKKYGVLLISATIKDKNVVLIYSSICVAL